MKLQILYITHDRLEYTKVTLPAILKQTFKDFKLTIWDNASGDGTREYLGTIKDPRVEIIYSEYNRPLVDVVNTVFSASEAELVGKIDNDILIPKDAFERLVEAHEDEHWGFLGGFHFKRQDLDTIRPSVTQRSGYAVWEKPHIGGNFIIRREDFTEPMEIDGQDKRIFMGITDYQYRLGAKGLKNGYLWSPILWFDHLEDTRSDYFVGNAEHQAYKRAMRGMSLEQNTEDNYMRARSYLEINAK